jgi:hypothetical protein
MGELFERPDRKLLAGDGEVVGVHDGLRGTGKCGSEPSKIAARGPARFSTDF